jgi:Arylsulfotransferase (ASST)
MSRITFLTFAILLAACGGDDSSSSPAAAGDTQDAAPETSGEAGPDGNSGSPSDAGVDHAEADTATTEPDGATGNTIGVVYNDARAYDAYLLFSPLASTTTYLIDNEGQLLHSWSSEFTPGNAVYLLENGNLLRTGRANCPAMNEGGAGGVVQEIAWDGTVIWEYAHCDAGYRAHHDVEPMPNGNILMISWELKTEAEAIAAGRDPSRIANGQIWPDYLLEIAPDGAAGGTVVWEWHVWDHLIQDHDANQTNVGVLSDHPERVDINYPKTGMLTADWLHVNAVDYNAELDQVVVSVHNTGELWVIDHSTTTQEALGHTGGAQGRGGDLLYRWGNAQAYGRGTSSEQRLFAQHDAHWIPSGVPGEDNLLVFNNGTGPGAPGYSSVVEIVPPVDVLGTYALASGESFGPTEPKWTYTAPTPTDFYAKNISGAQRLPNGNTLVCDGPSGVFFEVTSDGETVWSYINPVTRFGILSQGDAPPEVDTNAVFRATKYDKSFAGFVGRDLTPKGVIED